MGLSHSDRSARNLILSTLFLLGMNLSPFSNKEICASERSWGDRFVTNITLDGDCLGKSPCLATESFFLFAVFLMEWSSRFLLSSIEAFSVDDPDPWFFAPSVALPVNSNQSLPDGDRVFCAGFLSGFRWSSFTKLKWQLSYNSRIVENKLKCENKYLTQNRRRHKHMSARRNIRAACTSEQSDQSLRPGILTYGPDENDIPLRHSSYSGDITIVTTRNISSAEYLFYVYSVKKVMDHCKQWTVKCLRWGRFS